MARAYSCKRFPSAKVTVFRKETLETWSVTKKVSEMPFDQLDLKRAIAGDERAMQRLWSQHAPHIDAVVRRLCGDPELAAEHFFGMLAGHRQYRALLGVAEPGRPSDGTRAAETVRAFLRAYRV